MKKLMVVLGAALAAVLALAGRGAEEPVGFDRITSLERFGLRTEDAFSEKAIAYVREAGYNGIFVNGGSGLGGDSIPVECLVDTRSIPDLMPHSARRYGAIVRERLAKLRAAGIRPWLCMWCVTGATVGGVPNETTWNGRVRLEISAKLRKTPDLFGTGMSWRGNRPLCVSHPLVRAYYHELISGIAREYPEIEGLFFFPGDAKLEICGNRCPRCAARGVSQQERMTAFVNELYAAWSASGAPRRFYYAFWNLGQPVVHSPFNRAAFEKMLDDLAPKMGVAMSINDISTRSQALGDVRLNQPWGTCAEIGDQFRLLLDRARESGRPVMAVSEISQSEQFDPVCANMPFAVETLRLLRNAAANCGIDAVLDFWGNRPPFLADASHAVMRTYLDLPKGSDDEILLKAAARHYGEDRAERGVAAWRAFDRLMRSYPLAGWSQRFSFAIGREGARGPLYQPLVPVQLVKIPDWSVRMLLQQKQSAEAFLRAQKEWVAEFDRTAELIQSLSPDEADRIRLAGRLNVSIGATVRARELYAARDAAKLRRVIEAEMANREEQLRLSARLAPGSGVNALLVEEDITNMAFYLSDADFPDVPPERFSLSPVGLPY